MAKPLLLFLHGLGGDARSTWGNFNALISADSDLGKQVDTHFYSYQTKLFRWWARWRSLKIQDISLALKTEIEHKFSNYEQILLICHSLGGLIAKHYVCEQLNLNKDRRVRGIIFFATPHKGAALAAVADRISWNHHQVRQLRPGSDFLDLVMRNWHAQGCEAKFDITYVAGGQDMVVDRDSSCPSGVPHELIPDKNHTDLIKPTDDNDLPFLIVKHTSQRLFFSEMEDLPKVRAAIAQRDSNTLAALIANHGRSWIETKDADSALVVLQDVVQSFNAGSPEVVWSRYLIAIARLFRDQDASSTAFDQELIVHAEAIGLGPLIKGEIMEFARKRNNREDARGMAIALFKELQEKHIPMSANNAYALGTAYFLLGNLYRFGGQYQLAMKMVDRARSIYLPTILSHQIELAHCLYSSAVCRAMEGKLAPEDIGRPLLGPESRRFSEGLIMLARSHSAWSASRVGEASDFAVRAATAFGEIQFGGYANRARSLGALLGAWSRLEYGASVEKAVADARSHASVIRGMTGDSMALGTLKDWIRSTRPSSVLGMLQFAAAFGKGWTSPVGEFALPPVLCLANGDLEWRTESCMTLQEADVRLRSLMGIALGARLPLLAD